MLVAIYSEALGPYFVAALSPFSAPFHPHHKHFRCVMKVASNVGTLV